MLVHALVNSRLDYSSGMLYCISRYLKSVVPLAMGSKRLDRLPPFFKKKTRLAPS